MQPLQNDKIKNPIIVNLLSKLSRICESAQLVFCWIPSYMGIHGNETVDRAAKSALSQDILPLNYLILILNLYSILFIIHDYWQDDWNE